MRNLTDTLEMDCSLLKVKINNWNLQEKEKRPLIDLDLSIINLDIE